MAFTLFLLFPKLMHGLLLSVSDHQQKDKTKGSVLEGIT